MKCLYVFLIASCLFGCKQNQKGIGFVTSNCTNELANDLEILIYEVAWYTEANFQNALSSLPDIEDFGTYKNAQHPGFDRNILGITNSNLKRKEILEKVKTSISSNDNLLPMWTKEKEINNQSNETSYRLYLLKNNNRKISIKCNQVLTFELGKNHDGTKAALMIQLDQATAKKFNYITEVAFNNGRQSIAFVIGDVIYSCPYIAQPIFGDTFELVFESSEEANSIASLLK